MLLENPWQEDNFQSYGEIENNRIFEFGEVCYGVQIVGKERY